MLAIAQPMRKIDRLAIDTDQLHFGMRYAERFDHVLDGCVTRAFAEERTLALPRGEEIIQFGIKAEMHLDHDCQGSLAQETPRITFTGDTEDRAGVGAKCCAWGSVDLVHTVLQSKTEH